MILRSRFRPLTRAEQRLLRARIRDLEARSKRARGVLIPAFVVILLLFVLTRLASDAPSLVVTGFWSVVGAVVVLWVLQGTRKEVSRFRAMERACRSALARNEAEVYDVRSSAFAEFEELEDEGASYAFQLEGDRVVFVAGQQFCPAAMFPSHDFSLVHLLDEQGASIDELIEKRGPRMAAARTLPATVRLRLAIPDHLQVLEGRIEDIEERLDSFDAKESA